MGKEQQLSVSAEAAVTTQPTGDAVNTQPTVDQNVKSNGWCQFCSLLCICTIPMMVVVFVAFLLASVVSWHLSTVQLLISVCMRPYVCMCVHVSVCVCARVCQPSYNYTQTVVITSKPIS